MKTTTVRLDEAVLTRLDKLAESSSRSRSWVISEAIGRFVDYEEWFATSVNQGIKQADTGETILHDQITNWVESWDSDDEQVAPE